MKPETSPDAKEKPLPASPPKKFKTLAQSPCLVRLHQSITEFYYGTLTRLESRDGERTFDIFRASDGKKLSTFIIQTKRGFYFGLLNL